jgi:RNA polymerase sigma-70 factor (ECF subfamily)
MAQLSDDLLIKKAATGDKSAFAALYDRYVEQIYRHVYYRVSCQADAEDITQEVFIRAWKAIRRYQRGEALFVSWLLVIARNLVTDFYRARKKDDLLEDKNIPTTPDTSPEVALERRFEKDELRKAISKLKDLKQKVLIMRFIDGFSYSEISRALRKSEGAIRVIQYRALLDLRKIIGREEESNG